MLRFENCTFKAMGQNKKDQVFGITLTGEEDIQINDCIFEGIGYSAILNQSIGNVLISRSIFNCDNLYNPIEGTQVVENGNVTIKDCIFLGTPGNNFINFYKVKNNSIHKIENCTFAGQTQNNILRLSNLNNAISNFNLVNCEYTYTGGEADEYIGCILLQDYTNTNGQKQNFNNYTITIENLIKPNNSKLFYVYENDRGIIDTNDPILIQK